MHWECGKLSGTHQELDYLPLNFSVSACGEMNVDRAKAGWSAVKVERNLVRGALVLRLLLCGLRRCH
jgi:hypothetical protein